MDTINAVLAAIPKNKSVRIDLPLVDSNHKQRLPCIFQADVAPSFTLLFPENTLDKGRIDSARKCTVVIDMAGQNLSLAADIDDVINDRELRMVARDFINHSSVREFFRVDVRTPLMVTSLLPPSFGGDSEWKLTGETVDLSGAGLLAALPETVEHDRRLRLHLVLPTGDGTLIPIVARAVRTQKVEDHLYHVAFYFDQITEEDQDRIMASCFELQRRILRMKA